MKLIHTLIFVLTFAMFTFQGQAQELSTSKIEITGNVYNATTLEPLEAATVSCSKFSSGFTNERGEFSIEVRSLNDIITVQLEGYHKKDVPVRGLSNVAIYLVKESNYSPQAIAYGAYGSKNMLYTTGSVATLSPNYQSSTNKMNESSGDASFDGRIAGLDVRSRNGIKGMGSNIFMRGFSSLYRNNQPLVVVDGMVYDIQDYGNSIIDGYYMNPLNGIAPEDIDNITVVRDASTTYGSKAANGVVYIRTSHASKQATTIDLYVKSNFEVAPSNVPMLGAEDYRTLLNDLMVQRYGLAKVSSMPFINAEPNTVDYYKYNNNNDWQQKVYGNAFSNNYNLRIKGGDDVALYSLSVGFLRQNGTVKNSDNSKFNLRFNSDIKFSPNVTLNANIGFYYSKKSITGSGIENYIDPVYLSRVKAPFLFEYQYDENGVEKPDISDYDFLNLSNPVALVNRMTQNDAAYRLFGSFNFDWKITDALRLQDMMGLSFDKDRQRSFIPSTGVYPDSVEYGVVTNQMLVRVFRNFQINNDLHLDYSKEFGVNHQLSMQLGTRLNISSTEEDWAGDYNSPNDQIQSLGSGDYLLRINGGFSGDWASVTNYLSTEYAYNKKYIASLYFSIDGSSRYGIEAGGVTMFDTPFLPYYGISGAWLVSSENFMAKLHAIDLLKLRASYGTTGNDDIGNYISSQYYVPETFLGYQGIVLGTLYNPALGPEKNTKLNVGIDASLFKERMNISVDAYSNETTNMFDFVEAPEITGFAGYYTNFGGFTTNGVDLSINGRVISKKNLSWDLGAVVSKYKTNVNEINGNSVVNTIFTANILTETGSPISQFYGYKTKGVYSTSAEAAAGPKNRMDNESSVAFTAGDVIFDNFDNSENIIDGEDVQVIDENDMQVIGDPNPDFTGEIFTKVRYKNLSLEASLAFSYGADAFNYMRYSMENMSSFNNQTQAVLNRWRYEGQKTDIPKATYGDPMANSRFSDRWIEDASYARLKNVTVSYLFNFNSDIIKNAEVFATGVNLFTATKYTGVDPEFSIRNSALYQGIDLGMVPQNKMILLGVRLGL